MPSKFHLVIQSVDLMVHQDGLFYYYCIVVRHHVHDYYDNESSISYR